MLCRNVSPLHLEHLDASAILLPEKIAGKHRLDGIGNINAAIEDIDSKQLMHDAVA